MPSPGPSREREGDSSAWHRAAVGQVRLVAARRLVALADSGNMRVLAGGAGEFVALADVAGEVAAAGAALRRSLQLGRLVDQVIVGVGGSRHAVALLLRGTT